MAFGHQHSILYRRQHPEADADEVERLLHRRIELARAANE